MEPNCKDPACLKAATTLIGLMGQIESLCAMIAGLRAQIATIQSLGNKFAGLALMAAAFSVALYWLGAATGVRPLMLASAIFGVLAAVFTAVTAAMYIIAAVLTTQLNAKFVEMGRLITIFNGAMAAFMEVCDPECLSTYNIALPPCATTFTTAP